MRSIPRQNNFDLIRILAALQVVFIHGSNHLEIANPWVTGVREYFLQYFPGVPIFFFVSGFLIFWSLDRTKDLKRYWQNRALRIFPALVFCVLLSVILLLIDFPGKKTLLISTKEFYIWISGQLTFFQFYTPDMLRFWGVGTPNGSLWTITVELQFYVVVPLLIWMLNRTNIRRGLLLILLVVISMAANYLIGQIPQEDMAKKLGSVFILPYLYYFIAGIAAYLFWDRIRQFVENKFLYWFVAYVGFVMVFGNGLGYHVARYWIETVLNPVSTILLAGFVCSLAFSSTEISHRLLKGNDISYGVYIYHMLVINYFVHNGLLHHGGYLAAAFIITCVLAYLSWVLIEKPFLRMKNSAVTTPGIPSPGWNIIARVRQVIR